MAKRTVTVTVTLATDSNLSGKELRQQFERALSDRRKAPLFVASDGEEVFVD